MNANLETTLRSITETLALDLIDVVCVGGAPANYHHQMEIRDLDFVVLENEMERPDPELVAQCLRDRLGLEVEVFPEYEDDDTGRIAWACKTNLNGYPIDILCLRDHPFDAEEAAMCLDFTVNAIWFVLEPGDKLRTKAVPNIYPSLFYGIPNKQLDPNLNEYRIQYIKQKFPQYQY